MKRKIIFIIVGIMYLLIISFIFSYLSLKFDNDNILFEESITLIDVPKTQVGYNNEEIIDEYINKYNNNDVVGEIKIINTDYKRAIMQSSDNDYYLNHLEDKTSNFMGSIYLDFRIDIETDDKLLIFGHNSDTIDMPFKILENYYSQKYYKFHKYIQITTKNKTRLYEIYSIFVEVKDFSYMKTNFVNKNDWYEHVKSFKNKSIYDTGVDISEDDNILILQTCSTHHDYKNYTKKYLLVIGKEIINN